MNGRLTYFFSLLALALTSQGQSVMATLDSSNILVGDQIHFTIRAHVPKGMDWKLPVFGDTLVAGVEILDISGPDTTYQSDTLTELTLDLLITSFDSAYYVIPPIPMQVGYPGDSVGQMVWSEANLLSSFTMPVDLNESYFDIKDLLPFPITLREALIYSLIGFAIALVLLLALYMVSRLRQGKSLIPSFRKAEPPHLEALRELEQLRIEQLWQKGEAKEYYVRLSDILRNYIERQFKMPAMESTSDEIRELFKANSMVVGLSPDLDAFLNRSDMVKFAKAQPMPEEHAQSFEAVVGFVKRTMPTEDVEDNRDELHQDAAR